MFVPFDTLPDSARIWIYQSDRRFTDQEAEYIQKTITSFCEEWAAHGSPIKSSVLIQYHQFIILAADESFTAASGCSIDTTVRLFQQLETALGCSLFNRTAIAFLVNDEIMVCSQPEVREKFAAGILNKSSLAFNNVLSVKGDLKDKWLVPVENSWIKRFLPKDAVAS